MEEIVDLSKNDVTQKPREGQIRRDEVQWTAMSISFKQALACYGESVRSYFLGFSAFFFFGAIL